MQFFVRLYYIDFSLFNFETRYWTNSWKAASQSPQQYMNVRCHSIFHLRNISSKTRGSSVSTIKAFWCIQLTVGIRHHVMCLLAICFTFSVNYLFTIFSNCFFLDSEAGFHDSAHAGTTGMCNHVQFSPALSKLC